jgi:hypothetical protein
MDDPLMLASLRVMAHMQAFADGARVDAQIIVV